MEIETGKLYQYLSNDLRVSVVGVLQAVIKTEGKTVLVIDQKHYILEEGQLQLLIN
jgi:hypothetical protein